jgi:hypothetical protein
MEKRLKSTKTLKSKQITFIRFPEETFVPQ